MHSESTLVEAPSPPVEEAPAPPVESEASVVEAPQEAHAPAQAQAQDVIDPRSERDRLRAQEWAEAIAGLSFADGVVTVEQPPAEESTAAARELMREGDAHLQSNRRTEAVKAYASAAKAAPSMPQPYFALGQAMITKGKADLAVASFRRVTQLVPGSVEAHVALAGALDQGGQRREAVAEMKRAVELDPRHGPAHERLAIWHYYLGDDATAWKHVHAAREAGHALPPQFVALLSDRTADPG